MYGVSTYDPATWGLAVAALAGLGCAATFLATRRIVRLDPAAVLQSE